MQIKTKTTGMGTKTKFERFVFAVQKMIFLFMLGVYQCQAKWHCMHDINKGHGRVIECLLPHKLFLMISK